MIVKSSPLTRRGFGRICAGGLLIGRCLLRAMEAAPLTWAVLPDSRAGSERRYRADAPSDMEAAPLTWAVLPDSRAGSERRYRADAQIVLLSIPVFHRNGVGDGAAIWRESLAEDGAFVRLLEFTGRSAPEHAAGLNRFGFIQELSRSAGGACAESIYFGLMTSSPEESAAEARKALHSNSKEISFSVIEAHIAGHSVETAAAHFLAPARTSPADRGALIDSARQALSVASKKKDDLHSIGPMPRPFLHTLADLLSRPDSSQAQYLYNGRLYYLKVERFADPKAANVFREQRLIAPNANVTRVAGSLWRQKGDKPIEFRLWIEEGAARPIPLRIEYQPKPYLRLTFEALA